jgi:hypothetical protein
MTEGVLAGRQSASGDAKCQTNDDNSIRPEPILGFVRLVNDVEQRSGCHAGSRFGETITTN